MTSVEKKREAYQSLLTKSRELTCLSQVSNLLNWDQEVMMPKKGVHQRAEQTAIIQKLSHDLQVSPEWQTLFEVLDPTDTDFSPEEQADIREARKSYKKATQVPSSLVEELAKLEVKGTEVWSQARKEQDFSLFAPLLKEIVRCEREYADAIREDGQSRYNALLDVYEPNETAENIQTVFAELREQTVLLLDEIRGSERGPNPKLLEGKFPVEKQQQLSNFFIREVGYDTDAGRLDVTTHPFCSGAGNDVRITTRYNEDAFHESLFGSLHEAGHALYEQGIPLERIFNPSGTFCSMGIHESQSRFWENMIGRSSAFWKAYYPKLQEVFPSSFQAVSEQDFYHAVNHVTTSLIRVEADEVTYNLHIILRFQIEQELISGTLEVDDIPERWNQQFQHDFGLTPPNPAQGCLQDIHWSAGLFGYFPTYALGNLYSAQFLEALTKQMGDISTLVQEKNFSPILQWFRENVHQHARTHYAKELCHQATGSDLSCQPFVSYLRNKYKQIYSGVK